MKKIYVFTGILAVIALIAVLVISFNNNPTPSAPANDTASKSQPASPLYAAATNQVKISNYMFEPADIKIKVGTTVTWTNHDSVSHSIVSDNGMTPNGKPIGKDETYSYTFNKADVYKYHCSPHPYMHGSVLVENN